jgi:hypothetical protein
MIRSRLRTVNNFVPKLESLNDRIVPSCTWVENGDVLTITGSQGANDVVIEDDGTTLTITCDGESVNVSANVTDVVLNLRAGGDTVSYTLSGDLVAGSSRKIEANLGNGNDTFAATLDGNLLDGSSLDVTARGANGKDTLNFAAPASDVGADASLTVEMQGGNGTDAIDATLGGVLLGDFVFLADGGNGKDEVSGDLTFDVGSTGTADAQVLGKNGKDTLALLVTDNSGDDGDPTTTDASTLGTSSFVADGGHGPDSVDVSDDVEVLDSK